MSGKSICLSSVLMAFLSLGVVRGQDSFTERIVSPPNPPTSPGTPNLGAPPAYNTSPGNEPAAPPPPFGVLVSQEVNGSVGESPWIRGIRPPGTLGPMGGNGPIGWEVYLDTGFSFAVGGNYFGKVLGPGWAIEGGGRTLFFNPTVDAAWVVEMGVGNINNDADNRVLSCTLTLVPNRNATSVADEVTPAVTVTSKGMNRTYVNLGFGRDWYVWGSAESDGQTPVWRVGVTGGGRYGTMKLDVNELPHLTDVLAGAYLCAHTDIEYPFGPGFFEFGIKAEWAYTWDDILQRQNNSDVQDMNLLFTLGYRY